MSIFLIAVFLFLLVAMVYGIVAISGDYAAQWTGTETRAQRNLRQNQQLLAEINALQKISANAKKIPG
jgi:flagellar basal body-associated protein FliL